MGHINSASILSISLLVLGLLVIRYHRRPPLPLGPKGLPIVGNLVDFKKVQESGEPPWITYIKWSHLYGDVFTFHIFGSRTIVLNSYKAIMDLLEHQSQNYSDRPRCLMLNELLRWGWDFAFMRYSDSWRLHRKLFHEYFRPRAVSQYYEIQRERTSLFIQNLGISPKDFFEHVRTHSGGIVLEITYGYRSQDSLDSYVKLVDKAMVGMNEAGVGKYLVDYFPILKYIPGANFKRKAEVWAQNSDQLLDLPWEMIKDLMDEGTAVPCFCTQNLEELKSLPTSSDVPAMEEVIKNCAAAIFLGGGETTVSAILSFILAMVLHPEIQARAQKELDEVTGSNRLPDFSDRDSLPYIEAILAEVLRWNPVAPFGIPHHSVNDNIYEGYLIPGGNVVALFWLVFFLTSLAGSTIVANIWAVCHDESLYGPNTLSFNPDRFMKQDRKDLPPNPETVVFGFGRRICPGRYLAINSVWLAMTYLLASFTISKEVDGDGKEIDPVVEYTLGLSSHPRPFDCRFIPRPSAPTSN
ncbi:cytochrome P450 [Marasmius fiardii PR-910]|nr:cytochrome P450 [Marasmius fiardii PR-910]